MESLNEEILRQLSDINRTVGEVKGSLSGFIMAHIRHEDKLKEHDNKIEDLQRLRWKGMGIVSVLMLFVTGGVAWLSNKIFGS